MIKVRPGEFCTSLSELSKIFFLKKFFEIFDFCIKISREPHYRFSNLGQFWSQKSTRFQMVHIFRIDIKLLHCLIFAWKIALESNPLTWTIPTKYLEIFVEKNSYMVILKNFQRLNLQRKKTNFFRSKFKSQMQTPTLDFQLTPTLAGCLCWDNLVLICHKLNVSTILPLMNLNNSHS